MATSNKKKRIWLVRTLKEDPDAILLLTASLFSLVVAVVTISRGGDTSISLILLLLSLLSTSGAIERLRYLKRIRREISLLREVVRKKETVEILHGSENISRLADECIMKAERLIRATSFSPRTTMHSDEHNESTPIDNVHTRRMNAYNDLLINVLTKARALYKPISYRLVYRIGREDVEKRIELFKKFGLRCDDNFIAVDSPTNFNMLIIDNKFLFIAFLELKEDERFMCAIFVHNDKALIEGISNWYDDHLYGRRP